MEGGHREQVVARKVGPQEGAKLGGQRERGMGESEDSLGPRVLPSCRLYSRNSGEVSGPGSMA